MTDIEFIGRVDSALTHMALLGAAALLHDAGVTGVAVWFADGDVARPRIRFDDQPACLARTIRTHATDAAAGWVGSRIPHEGPDLRGVMSPRLKAPTSAVSWRLLQEARWAEIDTLTTAGRRIDLALIGALGEPAYWPTGATGATGATDTQPDRGASRWEMKTRNRGEEFVGDRLSKLAAVVAARTDDAILDGLTGRAVLDDTGGNVPGSRTATGFARPGPVDSALAWCALWGISNFPLSHHVGHPSQTPTSYPRHRVHPATMVLPVVSEPTSLHRLRAVIRSQALDAFTSTTDSDTIAAGRWLRDHGVVAVVRFPIAVAGSTSAPERQILDGRLEMLS